MIDTEKIPRCPSCKSLAVSMNLDYRIVREHPRESDGLRIVDEISVKAIAFHCSNFHYWNEEVKEA